MGGLCGCLGKRAKLAIGVRMCGCGKMSNILDQEETRKTLEKRKVKIHETKNDIQGRCLEKSMEIVKGVKYRDVFVHINKGIHPRCLLLKGEIILCSYLHVFILLLYFFVSLIGNLDQNNDIFA